MIHNFSRSPFTKDQEAALRQLFGENIVFGEPSSMYFEDAKDFALSVAGRTVSVIVPPDILLQAEIEGLMADNTILLFWRSDKAAMSRGNFAARGLVHFKFLNGRVFRGFLEIEPTEEINFKTEIVYPYKG